MGLNIDHNNGSELFKQNLERFAEFSPDEAKKITILNDPSYKFFDNENGELNLKVNEEPIYSTQSIKEEALNWLSHLNLKNSKVLYVFGVGLGAYYDACKEWLKEDFTRFLIFIETDPKIISCLFQTEQANKLLHDPQVRIHYVEKEAPFDGSALDSLTTAFLFDPYVLSALNFYKQKFAKDFEHLGIQMSHTLYSKQGMSGEFLTGSAAFFLNFYENLKKLPESYLGDKLFNQFKDIPAIICGAGPSLEKNIQLLKTLGDRALIIAGGTSINALNSYDVFPHLTVGVDPNPTQLMRLLGNNAYETPFFYRNRIFPEALNLQSGEKLYVTGTGGYEIPKLFEKRFGIEDNDPIDEGYNVINLSVSIAKALGCNPIILCGMDLAYTNNQSYLAKIKFHALHNFKKTFITKGPQDEPIGFKDMYGQPTTTLWKWVNEASWYTHFAKCNPHLKLINATEGGIGFPDIEGMSLDDVSKKYLEKSYDLEGLIHQKIQNSHFSKDLTSENVLKKLKLLRKSLGNCEKILQTASEECKNFILDFQPDAALEDKCRAIDTFNKKIQDEDFGKYILSAFSKHYFWLFEKRMPYFLYDTESKLKNGKIKSRMELELDCYHFLQRVTVINKSLLDSAIKSHSQAMLSKKENKIKNEKKTFQNKPIIDVEQKIENGLLEGNSIYYDNHGSVLSSTWFEKGLREGIAQFYYPSGKLFATKTFKHGLPDGEHRFFYEDGTLKSLITHHLGQLDGDVLLYYPNGELKRELHFKSGMREGIERMWNERGQLVIEAFYLADQPCGISKWWYDNGVLKQEVRHEAGKYEVRGFLDNGQEIPKTLVEEEDYFDKLIKMTNTFMESIHDLLQKADLVLPFLDELQKDKIHESKNELNALKLEVDKISLINKEIQEKFSGNAHLMEEPIWKSSALQKSLDEKLNTLIGIMKSEITAVQQLIMHAIEKQQEKSNE